MLGKIKEPVAVVRVSKKNAEILAMQNLAQAKWIVETPDGKLKDINPTEFLPLEKGLKIYFTQHEKGEII